MLLLFFYCNTSLAQKQYQSWVFMDSCSLVFSNDQVVANTIPNPVQGCSAMICNKHTGQLLFYSDGQSAYDRNGNVMPNGASLKGCGISSQGALIVPDPADDSTYYLFTTDCIHAGGYNGLNYNVVNMRLNGGLGDITKKNIFLCDNLSEKVTAVRACSFDGFWIITYVDSLRDFFAWRLTANGIATSSPVISPSGFPGYSSNLINDVGFLTASPNGNLLMAAYGEIANDTCNYLYNFNKTTGAISFLMKVPWDNVVNHTVQAGFGVCFSPDNSKVYFTNIRGTGDSEFTTIFQFDLNTKIITSLYKKTNADTALFAAIEIGPDNRVYVANSARHYVVIINNPNSTGLACNFNVNGISVNPNRLFWDLPNNIDALYYPDTLFKPGFTYTVNCADSTVTFTDNSNLSTQEWWWSFGDSASGGNNHSKEQNPTHNYTKKGIYTVSMWAYEGCAVDSIIKTVTISNCPPPAPQLIIPTIIYSSGNQTKWHIINLPQGNNIVTLYDELGQVIYKSLNYPNDYDMRNLPPAMYFYRLTLESGQVYIGKIILVK